jgi:antitoxin VapB
MVYILLRGYYMQTARLFINGRSQAVRLPKEYQFKGDDVYIQKVGDIVILFPNR